MPLAFIKRLLKGSKTKTVELEPIIRQLQEIRLNSSYIALCPDSTGYNWLGIKRGAIALFAEKLIVLPQYYSTTFFTEKQLEQLCEAIIELGFEQVFLRGFPPYFEQIIDLLKHKKKVIRVIVLYGGFLSENAQNEGAKSNFTNIIGLAKNKKIDLLGFNKNGLSETVNKLYGVGTVQYYNKTHIYPDIAASQSNEINIGVLANHDFRKNIDNQVAASLLVESSKVHVLDSQQYTYLDVSKSRIVVHPKKNHRDFSELITSMKLNMYVSFSESWGHVITESMAYGIPCLASNTSSIFEHNQLLADYLVVNKVDDSYAIYLKAASVLSDYDMVSAECVKYVSEINDMADRQLASFIA